jgi:peptide/nickel transport system ATP-binding protein
MLHAVDDISFTLEDGKTLGVVGESGCGKSTLGRTLLHLLDATDGQIFFENQDITNPTKNERHAIREQMQIIFQDPFSSLNPRFCVADLIADPIRTFGSMKSSEIENRVYELMDLVGLSRRYAYSYPHELDGGRRQRIGIARALSLDPKFIVCDEPVSALDVSIQAQILNLLQDLQEQKKLTYIFVTHDLSVVKHISTDILVMYIGSMVEKCPSKELFAKPLHPYTKGLLSAIPIPNIHHKREKVQLQGELSSPIDPPDACRFVKRCPYATDICRCKQPVYEEVLPNHFVSCHNCKQINNLK